MIGVALPVYVPTLVLFNVMILLGLMTIIQTVLRI